MTREYQLHAGRAAANDTGTVPAYWGDMEPFPTNAVAIEWEFRCRSREFPVLPWEWRCKARDGSLVAKSAVRFRSFAEALSDAKMKGFSYDAIHASGRSA